MHTESDVLKAVRAVVAMGHGAVTVKIHQGRVDHLETSFFTKTSHDLSRLSCRPIGSQAESVQGTA